MGKIEDKLAIIGVLLDATDPMRPTDVGEPIGMGPLEAGRYLSSMEKSGLVNKPDKKRSLYLINDKGREYYANPPEEIEVEIPEGSTERKYRKEVQKGSTEDIIEEVIETIPSQADLFKAQGELLGVGGKKGDIKLDTIVKYIQRLCDLDNLQSVWNGLTDMGVANDVKKRWIRLYAQCLHGKEIPEELREKLEIGQEGEKVAVEKPGEVLPKPKRFSLIGNDIIGDPEGDLTFKEALQQRAQNLGAAPEQANSVATIIEAMKVGPEMSTSLLTSLLPLLTKEPPKQDNTMIQLLQQQVMQLASDKSKAEMDAIRAEMRASQKSPEAEEQTRILSQQIETLREEIHKQEIARLQEQQAAVVNAFSEKLSRLEQQIAAGIQGKIVDTKMGLMSQVVTGALDEAKGLRQDVKAVLPTLTQKSAPPRQRSNSEKARFSDGLEKGIEKSKQVEDMENQLFYSPKPEG